MTDVTVLRSAIAAAENRRSVVASVVDRYRVELPLRYWRQEAHLTTPATDAAMARKAVEGGTRGVAKAMQRLGLSATDLAATLDLPRELVEATIEQPLRAPLVMLDGEDSIAPGEGAAFQALEVAATTFVSADWGTGPGRSLRFFRPPGLSDPSCVDALFTLLWQVRRLASKHSILPLDGIVWPKINHPEEVATVNDLIRSAEETAGIPVGQIRVAYLIESGWAVSRLPEIVIEAGPRLAGLIFGLADYSADLGLPAIETDHPTADWARAEIVAVAGSAGVPAIDGMTLRYPVLDDGLDLTANRTQWLARMSLAYDDACNARRLGMTGKWVGHPSQLFAVMLAFRANDDPRALAGEAAKLEAYRQVVDDNRGSAMIAGQMSDRATDRHARVTLRKATARGQFDPARALSLGVIDEAELLELRDEQEANGG